MHELYLMKSMIDKLRSSAAEQGISHISKIYLVNGKFSGASTKALNFAFSIFSNSLLFSETHLAISEPELTGRCQDCRQDFNIKEFRFSCSVCGSGNIQIVSGQELYIDYYEGE